MESSLAVSGPSPTGAAPGDRGHRPDPRHATWRLPSGVLSLERPRIMGVLNLTDDSFWQDSRLSGVDAALERADAMLAAGADILDLGGESTRPGARPIPADEEIRRVVPVITAVRARWPDATVSVDTVKSQVAARALEAGAAIINDVSGLRLDPGMAGVAAEAGAGVILMHSRGDVTEMASYDLARYGDDPVADMVAELHHARSAALSAGVEADRIVLDPGLGFSKRTEHSAAILAGLHRLLELGSPLLVGPSRKRFVGELAGGVPVEARVPGTLAACVVALTTGARLFRVHDVAPARQALDVADALLAEAGGGPAC